MRVCSSAPSTAATAGASNPPGGAPACLASASCGNDRLPDSPELSAARPLARSPDAVCALDLAAALAASTLKSCPRGPLAQGQGHGVQIGPLGTEPGPSPQESLCQPHHILEEEGAPGRGLPYIAAMVQALLERP